MLLLLLHESGRDAAGMTKPINLGMVLLVAAIFISSDSSVHASLIVHAASMRGVVIGTLRVPAALVSAAALVVGLSRGGSVLSETPRSSQPPRGVAQLTTIPLQMLVLLLMMLMLSKKKTVSTAKSSTGEPVAGSAASEVRLRGVSSTGRKS